jgi:hypothetical protein
LEAEVKWFRVLQSHGILEYGEHEAEFEYITPKEAKELCAVPIAVVSLVDLGLPWFKSKQGVDA